MKNGYDQHFKKVQKIAFNEALQPSLPQAKAQPKRRVQSQDAKALAQELRTRMRPQMVKQKKTQKPISWKLAGFSLIGLIVTTIGLLKADDIEKYAKSVEVSFLGTAYAEETKPATAPAAKPADAAATAAGGAEKKAEEPVAKKDYSEDEINHFSKLNERKRELDAREEELNRMEQEIQNQKGELEKRLAELENTRRNISSVLDEKVQGDDKKIDNLVQMYSTMKPQQAAKALEEMDESLAIEILGRMKKKNAAEIMNLVKSEKVKTFSEKYAGYKRNNN
ncbi:MAG: MotE family protein [Pseudobdellovibrionaceae bacterium]